MRLRNITDGETTLLGLNANADDSSNVQTVATLEGRFGISNSRSFEIQHHCEANGTFGLANGFGENEVYLFAEFWKIQPGFTP